MKKYKRGIINKLVKDTNLERDAWLDEGAPSLGVDPNDFPSDGLPLPVLDDEPSA